MENTKQGQPNCVISVIEISSVSADKFKLYTADVLRFFEIDSVSVSLANRLDITA